MTEAPHIRMSDDEREAAIAALSEHYASGRLDKDEYDDRVEQAWAAKFHSDLDPLFGDLPRHDQPKAAAWHQQEPLTRHSSHRRHDVHDRAAGAPRPRGITTAFPVLAAAAVIGAAIALSMPWLLFGLFWVFACGGPGRQHTSTSHRW